MTKTFGSLYENKKVKTLHPELESAKYIIAIDKPGKLGAKNFKGFNSPQEIFQFIKTTNSSRRCFHEYRNDQSCKLFADFDLKTTLPQPDFFIDYIKETFQFEFNNYFHPTPKLEADDLILYTSCRPGKISYHLTSSKYHFNDISILKPFIELLNTELKQLAQEGYADNCSELFALPGGFDKAIYSSKGCFRLLWSHKSGQPLSKKKILGGKTTLSQKDFIESLITVIPENSTLVTDENVSSIIEDMEYDEDGITAEDMEFCSGDKIKTMEAILKNLDIRRSDEYDDWLRVCFVLKNGGYPVELLHNFSERSENYVEESVDEFWDNFDPDTKKKQVTVGTLMFWLKKDAPAVFKGLTFNINTYAMGIHYRSRRINESEVKKWFPKCRVIMEDSKYLSDDGFASADDVIVKSPLGSGKTEQIANLEELKDMTKKVLFVVNRRKLSKEVEKRFGEMKLNNYLDLTSNSPDEEWRRVIVQTESLHKIPMDMVYDLVIFDEFESSVMQFNSSTMHTREIEKQRVTSKIKNNQVFDRYEECAATFLDIMRESKRIIIADAFISRKALHVFKEVKRSNGLSVIINTYKPVEHRAIQIPMGEIKGEPGMPTKDSLIPIFDKAVEKLQEGKKIFWVFASLTKLKQWINYVGDGFKGRSYSSEHNAGKKISFNAEVEWRGQDWVAITSSITTGINFGGKWFDYKFVYFQATPLVRDVFQSIMRVRQTTENTIYFTVSEHIIGQNVGSLSLGLIKEEFQNAFNNMSTDLKSKINPREYSAINVLQSYNIQEERVSRLNYNVYYKVIESYMAECNYIIEVNADRPETDDLEDEIGGVMHDWEFEEVYRRVKYMSEDEMGMIMSSIDNGKEDISDRHIVRLHTFVTKMNLDVNDPELGGVLTKIFSISAADSEQEKEKKTIHNLKALRAKCYKIREFSRGDWKKPNGDEIMTDIELSNPKLKPLAQFSVINEIIEKCGLDNIHTIQKIPKETIESLDPIRLKKCMTEVFKIRDRKQVTVGGKKKWVDVKDEDLVKADCSRYVSKIMFNFCQTTVENGKRSRKRSGGKIIDVSGYEMKPKKDITDILRFMKV